jgi:hypothetical protein
MGIESLFDSLMDVETKALVADGAGGMTETWSTKTAGVPCRVRETPAQFRTTNDQGEFVYTHTIRCGAGVAIDETVDRVRWVSQAGRAVGKVLEIRSAINATARAGVHHRQLTAHEVR